MWVICYDYLAHNGSVELECIGLQHIVACMLIGQGVLPATQLLAEHSWAGSDVMRTCFCIRAMLSLVISHKLSTIYCCQPLSVITAADL